MTLFAVQGVLSTVLQVSFIMVVLGENVYCATGDFSAAIALGKAEQHHHCIQVQIINSWIKLTACLTVLPYISVWDVCCGIWQPNQEAGVSMQRANNLA